MKMKRVISMFLTFIMVGSLAACGGNKPVSQESTPTTGTETTATSETTIATEKEEVKEPVKISLFPANGNLTSGTVGGWLGEYFAENGIILDVWAYSAEKFNAILASGDYPDVMFFNTNKCDINAIIESGYLLDLNDYMDQLPAIKNNEEMQTAVNFVKAYVSNKSDELGVLPVKVGALSSKVNTGGAALMMNWELYEKIGSPEITCLEDTIDVFKQMQAAWPQADNGLKTYAMHLYSDQDTNSFAGIKNVLYLNGYTVGQLKYFLLGNTATNEFEYALEDDGIYKYGLKYYNTLYKEGLLDPDSITYDRQTVVSIVDTEGATLAGWPCVPAYETKGFMPVYYDGMRVVFTGNYEKFGNNFVIGISSKCENVDAALQLVNMFADPDSCFIIKTGPEGELWEYDASGVPVLTEEGIGYFVNGAEADIKGETFKNFNTPLIANTGFVTSFGKQYSASSWPEVLVMRNNTDTAVRWREFYGTETDFVELLGDNCVQIAFDDSLNKFVEKPSDEEELLWAAAQDILIEASWKMVYAESEAEFEKLWADAVAECNKLGIEELVQTRLKALDEAIKAKEALSK